MPGLEISVVFISDSGKQPQRNYEIQLECNNITYVPPTGWPSHGLEAVVSPWTSQEITSRLCMHVSAIKKATSFCGLEPIKDNGNESLLI